MNAQLATLELDVRRPGKSARGFVLHTPFSLPFLARLKSAVPVEERQWIEARGAWWIAKKHQRAIERLVLRFWPELQRMGKGEEDEIVSRDGVVAKQGRLAL